MPKKPALPRPESPSVQRSDSKAIVDAILGAGHELAAAGLDEVTMRAIAVRAGVGEASLYRYFPTKTALFAEVFRRQHAALLEDIERVLADSDTLEIGIHRAVETFAGFGEHEEKLRRALNFDIPLSWSLDELAGTVNQVRAALAEFLRCHRPELSPAEVERRVFFTVSLMRGAVMLRLLQPTRAPAIEDLIETLDAMVHGIATGQFPARG